MGSPEDVPPIRIQDEHAVRRVLVLLPPERASRALDAGPGGTIDVPLHPAGFLALVPEALPDPALGPLQVRRRDGAPLPRVTTDARAPFTQSLSVDVAPVVSLAGTTFLGPLPQGEVELEVVLGTVVVARIAPSVRAGLRTAVSVPIAAPTPR